MKLFCIFLLLIKQEICGKHFRTGLLFIQCHSHIVYICFHFLDYHKHLWTARCVRSKIEMRVRRCGTICITPRRCTASLHYCVSSFFYTFLNPPFQDLKCVFTNIIRINNNNNNLLLNDSPKFDVVTFFVLFVLTYEI